jgi:hypothetical protein
MPLTPVNCAAGVGCVEVGRDLASSTPAKLLIQLLLNAGYLKCDSGGLRLAVCDESQALPVAARPGLANGPGNLIRRTADGCGVYAPAPIIIPAGSGTRRGIPGTLGNFSAISHTLTYTNPDTARRLVTIDVSLSTIVEEASGSGIPVFVGIAEGLSTIADVNGDTVKFAAVSLTGSGDAGNIMNDARQVSTVIEVPGGATVTQTWRMRTVRHDNVITAGTGRGFLAFQSFIRTEQGLVL